MLKIEKGFEAASKTFRLPTEMIERLEVLAAKNKISMNKLVVQCLEYAIKNIDETIGDKYNG